MVKQIDDRAAVYEDFTTMSRLICRQFNCNIIQYFVLKGETKHFHILLFVCFLRYLPFVVLQKDNMPTVQANKLQNLDNSRIQPTAALLQSLLLLRPKHFESKFGKILVRHYYQSNYCYFGRSSDSLVLYSNRKCINVYIPFNRNYQI